MLHSVRVEGCTFSLETGSGRTVNGTGAMVPYYGKVLAAPAAHLERIRVLECGKHDMRQSTEQRDKPH